MSNRILSEPPRVGFLKRCPSCRKRFALKLAQSEPHQVLGRIDEYRCQYCGSMVVYAKQLPPDAV
jgi:DNA-directed RNA polymerase subunit RPC12/RpoP